MSDLIDIPKELNRLNKQLEKEKKDVNILDIRLKSSGFIDKAKPEIIKEAEIQLKDKKLNIIALEKRISDLQK
jgi:valyl-tRNA synthetase